MDLQEYLEGQMKETLNPGLIEHLGNQMGVSKEQAGGAAGNIMSVLLNALARNAATPQGAESLNSALEKDNHGGLLETIMGSLAGGNRPNTGGSLLDLGGLITGMLSGQQSRAANGAGILKHILGRRTEDTAAQIGQKTGIGTGNTIKMMAMLAPIVMGMLGKTKKAGNLSADGLGGLLDGFLRKNIQPGRPAQETNIGLAGRLLDRDGDGSAIDDIAGMIGGFLFR